MKISILTPDFSHNCFGRAWLLGKVLQRHYNVEIIGPTFGDGIWAPLSNVCDFDTKMVKGYPSGRFELNKMLKMISGNVIYASKPLNESFGVGLLKKCISGKPLVLDIDDWQLGYGKEFYSPFTWQRIIKNLIVSFQNAKKLYLWDKLVFLADDITVSNSMLKKKYGGCIIHHCRDTYEFNPNNYNISELKNIYLPAEFKKKYVISFIGTPRPHKGLEDLIEAVAMLNDENLLLIIVGMKCGDEYCNIINQKYKDLLKRSNVLLLPEQPFQKLPELLSISDLVVIPQKHTPFSAYQLPAKIFDAMAMSKPIISTRVADIPSILDNCGFIIDPDNPSKLAETIKYVINHPAEAKKVGFKAREEFVLKYSYSAAEENIKKIFRKYET